MRLLLAILGVSFAFEGGAHAETNISLIEVETRILDFDPQAGQKSLHKITVDWENGSVSETFVTGVTTFFGVELRSVRDIFRVTDAVIEDERASFRAVGETASGVSFLPSIDYNISIEIERSGLVKLSGCHDGYPAYIVRANNQVVYEFKHKSVDVLSLFGSCDTNISS